MRNALLLTRLALLTPFMAVACGTPGPSAPATPESMVPHILEILPRAQRVAQDITIQGDNLISADGPTKVDFDGEAAFILAQAERPLTVRVPDGIADEPSSEGTRKPGVVVHVVTPAGEAHATMELLPRERLLPHVDSVTPQSVVLKPREGLGASFTLRGSNLVKAGMPSSVVFDANANTALTTSAVGMDLQVDLPADWPLAAGQGSSAQFLFRVVVGEGANALNSNVATINVATAAFIVDDPGPYIVRIHPREQRVGMAVFIEGNQLLAAHGATAVSFDGVPAAILAQWPGQLWVTVPDGIPGEPKPEGTKKTGVVVRVSTTAGAAQSTMVLLPKDALAPHVDTITPAVVFLDPTQGAGVTFTITGANLGDDATLVRVRFAQGASDADVLPAVHAGAGLQATLPTDWRLSPGQGSSQTFQLHIEVGEAGAARESNWAVLQVRAASVWVPSPCTGMERLCGGPFRDTAGCCSCPGAACCVPCGRSARQFRRRRNR